MRYVIRKKEKLNYSSLFLLPMFYKYMKDRKKFGFINIYLDNNTHENKYKEAVHILFDPFFTMDWMKYEAFLANSPLCQEIYSIHSGFLHIERNEKVMFVFKIPDEFLEDYHNFLVGDYSKFSSKYTKLFNPKSIPYKVINRDKGLKRVWEKKLGKKLDLNSELYGLWKPKNEIFNYNKLKDEPKNNKN